MVVKGGPVIGPPRGGYFLFCKQKFHNHEDPQMHRINHVEQVLGECGVFSSLSVVQQNQRNHQRHGPLIVEAQLGIEAGASHITHVYVMDCMSKYDCAPDTDADAQWNLLSMEEPCQKGNWQQEEAAAVFRGRPAPSE